jgi:ABC-type Zn uptake system ZnuABC Zn-binding protein ZnuA
MSPCLRFIRAAALPARPFARLPLLAVLLFVATASAPQAWAQVKVVATTPEIAALVRDIGGGAVEVTALAKPLQDPHYLDAKPSYMVTLNRADVLFFTGLELEIGWLPLLIQGARNPDLDLVDLSTGIEVLGKPTGPVSRAEGDVHPDGNPHYWLAPRNGAVMAATIAAALKRADPDRGPDYDARYAAFRDRLGTKLAEWEAKLAPHKGTAVLDYHTTWLYFTHWAGLNVVNYVEEKPGIPPSAAHVRSVMAQIARDKIALLVEPNYIDPKIGEFLNRRTGITVLHLPGTVGGAEGTATWFAFFDRVVSLVADALANRT